MLAWIKAVFWRILAMAGSVYFAAQTYEALVTGDARLSRRYLPWRDVSWEADPQAYLLAVLISGGLSVFLFVVVVGIVRAMVGARLSK